MGENICDYYMDNGEEKISEDFAVELISEGKSIYEVIRIIEGVPLFLKEHLDRIERSAAIMKVKLFQNEEDIKRSIEALVRLNGVFNGNVKLVFNYNEKTHFLAYFIKHSYPDEEVYKTGVTTILLHEERENPNAKVMNQNFRQRVNVELHKKDAYEAILVDRNGYITEGSRSNIFVVKGNQIITAPLVSVLPGITREMIFKLCAELKLHIQEQNIDFKTIKEVEGIFLSGTSPNIMPISKVDNMCFASTTNPLILKLMKAYNLKVKKYVEEHKK